MLTETVEPGCWPDEPGTLEDAVAEFDDDGSESRFETYVEGLVGAIGHSDRAGPLRDYCLGLLMPGERKSVEPMAAVTAPARVSAQHQSLLHLVGVAPWSDDRVVAKVRDLVLPSIERRGPIEAWIIDDTGLPKKGRHSVGVARQYCGQLGKQDNCQVAVSLSIANHGASLPVAWRLYLPKDWAGDEVRREKAGVPREVEFATKPQIALAQVRAALADGLPRGVALMDAGYGVDTGLRTELTALGVAYAAGIQPTTTVWPQGKGPLPPRTPGGRGRPGKHMRRDADHQPIQVKALALGLPASAWQTINWREGSNEALTSRFARARVRPAHGDEQLEAPRPEEWLLIEWPKDEKEPTKYWLSTLPPDIPFADMVDMTKLRWRIERDYLELKQEVGLGHYEGRGWRGFHHHATLCIAAYGFLISERQTTPPSGLRVAPGLQESAVPDSYRPRGAASPARTAHPELNRHHAPTPHRRTRKKPQPMPMLQRPTRTSADTPTFVTQ